MSPRYALGAVLIAVAVMSSVILFSPRAEAAGTITGNLPANGGLALVSWSGGTTAEIVEASADGGCLVSSTWSFIGGFPIGYLVGAPDFVNSRFLAVYPNAQVPAGPLLLVCRPTLIFSPGDNVSAMIATQPAGASFVFSPGIYRGVQITPRDGDAFRGEPGAILSGAKVLNGFDFNGNAWSIGGQTSQLQAHGGCSNFLGQGYSGCQHPEQLFIDGVPLWQVTDTSQMAPGRWYFDYGADQIWILDDPNGRLVELSVTPAAFQGQAQDVTVADLVIERYASRAQQGAMSLDGGSGWLIENNEIRYNHGTGIRTHSDMVLRNNYVHHNGQIGVAGLGDRILVEGNEISFNGISGFNPFWEAGGTKFVLTRDLVVRNNHVHDNRGRGIWTDIDNVNSLIEGNLAENNDQSGIAHEISYSATIRNNTVRGNGQAFDNWLWGAQILVQNSSDTTITGNTVTVAAGGGDGIGVINQNRGSGNLGAYVSRNVTVANNDITYLGGAGQSGVADDTSSRFSCQDEAGVSFEGNTYRIGSTDTRHWFWCTDLDWSGLQASGVETQGIAIDG